MIYAKIMHNSGHERSGDPRLGGSVFLAILGGLGAPPGALDPTAGSASPACFFWSDSQLRALVLSHFREGFCFCVFVFFDFLFFSLGLLVSKFDSLVPYFLGKFQRRPDWICFLAFGVGEMGHFRRGSPGGYRYRSIIDC